MGLGALFNGTIFFGEFSLKDAHLNDLEISGLPLRELILNRTRMSRKLLVRNIALERLSARNLEVGLAVELSNLTIKTEADLRDSTFRQLRLYNTSWPAPRQGKKKVYLDGLTYRLITTKPVPDAKESWQDLWDWLWYSRFNSQSYSQMEAYLRRAGLRKWSDKIYITGKRRQVAKLSRWHPARWLTKFFWGLLTGYGRRPGRLTWPALALVLLGWAAFSPPAQDFGAAGANWWGQFLADHPRWVGFFLSLDRFLPGVDLGVARLAPPAEVTVFVWIYWHLQKILGWTLGLIALAAVYTRIRDTFSE